jgi:hypothetical protein
MPCIFMYSLVQCSCIGQVMPYGFSYGYSATVEGRICHVYLELVTV